MSSRDLSEEDPCPLFTLPDHILSSIVEKMPYKDFKTFNSCSSFSKDSCELLRKDARLLFIVDDIVINSQMEYITFEYDQLKTVLINNEKANWERIPPFIRFSCNSLCIHNVKCSQLVESQEISAERLIVTAVPEDAQFIQPLLKMTNPRHFHCYPCNREILTLPEVQQMRELDVYCVSSSPEDCDLLKLLSPILKISSSSPRFTPNGVAQLIQQWKEGKREIKLVQLDMEETRMKNIREALEEFPFENDERQPKILHFHEEKHEKCLTLEFWQPKGILIYQTKCSKGADDVNEK